MSCKYLIAVCSKTHLPCPHAGVTGKCDEAECTNQVVPTWNEMIDIYEAAMKPTARRLGNVRAGIKAFVAALGTEMDAKVSVTDDQVDAAHGILMKKYSAYTVDSVFGSYKACTSMKKREVKMEYRRRGKSAPDIDLPSIKKPALEPVTMTEAQHLAIREEMTIRRNSTKKSDHDKFKWLWFAWHFGVRPIDICNMRWESIVVRTNGKIWLDYIPSKTADKTGGRRAGGEIPREFYEEIRPFIGKADEYVIERHENKRVKSGAAKTKTGENSGRHFTLRKYVVNFARSIGIVDLKPGYALRKDCAATLLSEHGPLHEAQMLGHTPAVAMKHYADVHNLELRKGL